MFSLQRRQTRRGHILRGRTVGRQVPVRQRIPPGHRREDAAGWPHVRPGPDEHDHHRVHDDVLQVYARRHLLAVVQSIFQRGGQLYEPFRKFTDQPAAAADVVLYGHRRCARDGPLAESTRAGELIFDSSP